MSRAALIGALAALVTLGCEEAGSGDAPGEAHCTEERDPTGFYCGGRRDSTQDVVNRFDDFPDDAVWLFVDSAETGTLGPDGEDFEWTLWAQFPDEGVQFYWRLAFFVETPAPAIDGLFPGCDAEPGLTILRSRVLVPQAIDRYEGEVGPVVLDELTRTAFRQRVDRRSPDSAHPRRPGRRSAGGPTRAGTTRRSPTAPPSCSSTRRESSSSSARAAPTRWIPRAARRSD